MARGDWRKDSTVAELDQRIHASREVRRIHEGQWFLNLAYYRGEQWVKFDGTRLYRLEPGEERVMLTDNRIRGSVRSDVAKMTKTQPVWVGVPKDASDKEIAAARLRQRVFEHYWPELQLRRKLRLVLRDNRVMGSGFMKVTWDPTAGPEMRFLKRPDGSPITDRQGAVLTGDRVKKMGLNAEDLGQHEEATERMGDVAGDYRSPLEMFPDALASEEGLISCEYIGEESIHSVEALRRRFGDKVPQTLEGNTEPTGGVLASVFPGSRGGLRNRGAQGRKGVRVREYWSLPNKDDSKGRHCVWIVNGDLILEEELHYPFLPYVMFGGIPSGEFWPDGTVDDQISPQTELNKVESQIAENSERFGNPARLRSTESAGQNELDWLGLPGEEVLFHDMGSPGSVPSFLAPPEMPGYVLNRIPQIENALRTISAQSEVSQGTVPEGVTAAAAISMLQEANDTQLGPDIAEMENGLQSLGRMLLWSIRAFMKDERMLRIAGDDGYWDILSFRGNELGDGGEDEVQAGSGIPQSKAQKQAAIQTVLNMLIQNGQAPEPRELRRILRDFEVGGLEHFFNTSAKDQSQVNDEHRRFLAGEAFDPNPFDDDGFHVTEHADWFKSSTFMELRHTQDGRKIQEAAVMHWQAHQQKVQQAANNEALAQMGQQAGAKGVMPPDPAVVAQATGNGQGPLDALTSSPPAPPGG